MRDDLPPRATLYATTYAIPPAVAASIWSSTSRMLFLGADFFRAFFCRATNARLPRELKCCGSKKNTQRVWK